MQLDTKNFNLTKQLFVGNNIPFSKTAIIWNDIEISREQLFENCIRTADYLLKIGLKENDKLVLSLNDTPAVHEFFLGAIAVGIIPILVNPKLKQEELIYILNDSKAAALVLEIKPLAEIETIYKNATSIQSRNSILVQDTYVKDVSILENNKEYFYPRASKSIYIEEEDLEMHFVLKHKDAPAFWQYTSGTTGQPKAVVHSQVSMLVNSQNFAVNTLDIQSTDCIYSVPKMFFGYGLGNSLFFPLFTGATVILDTDWPTVFGMKNNIEKYKPTILFSVPKMFGTLLQSSEDIDYKSIRLFYSAGSNLNDLVNIKWEKATGKYIYQGIGCTEIGHVYLSTNPKIHSIQGTGKPVVGFQVELNKMEGQEISELMLQAPFKLLGYNDDKIGNKFLADNWYKTGDNFYLDSQNNYCFSSRSDDLFKINGRMVIPSIIENFVLNLFDVSEVVFLAVEDNEMSDVTSVLCITISDHNIIKDILKEQIKTSLEDTFTSYTLPKEIVFFDHFEYNSNGKIIKKRIKEKFLQTNLVCNNN